MSVATFIPTIWEARLMANFHKRSIADLITTKPAKIEGNKIIFNRVGAVNVKDYSGSVEWDDTNPSKVEINMDQKKYFAFKVDDVDAVQAAGDLIDPHTQEAGSVLQETVDTFVLGLYTGAHKDNVIGTDSAAIELSPKNAYDYIVDLNTKLNMKKVPKTERFTIINSQVLGLLSKDDRFTKQPVILENGVVEGQVINGSQIVVSEEIHNTSGKYKILALHKSGIGHGKQLNETEAQRLQNSFADGVRGLMVYGAGVLRPESLAILTATIAPTTPAPPSGGEA
ncbi:phage capsid protein [Bacillus thuringiensis]|uniref:phage major capsid protein n=1 Tax=Bacillus TaxID=1386 RepID=UPI000A397AFA|nr:MULTISPECIES: phage capsid protein [Bacillus cereus group]MCU4862907.1 phage capsid protein [Bacillus cereus]MCU5063738.1 phage capsid protein [Bacillus cereus]MCU5346245.1 phage capsid protein [Bacillus cereus]MCU5605062.1 phage capsid protein [Bacillus cereus]MCU5770401.1 phage capsid protein [Bacillus cereus]